MRFAVNLSFLFTERPFLDRFQAAADAGFRAVEFPWPEAEIDEVVAASTSAGVAVIQLNAHAGDLAVGDRGYANDPARVGEWRETVERALAWSDRLGGPAINLLVGNRLSGVEEAVQRGTLEDNLAWAVARVGRGGTRLLVEVLNDRDTPDYLLTRLADAEALLRAYDTTVLRLQFDTYHVASMGGDLVASYRRVTSLVGHVQVADVPGRHEPGTGSAGLGTFLRRLDAAGYDGYVSLEYVPSGATDEGLGWLPMAARAGRVAAEDLPLA